MSSVNKVKDLVEGNKVMVFSKSYCPFCKKAKDAIGAYTTDYTVMELDGNDEGDDIQAALRDLTGGSTVPRVFIGGKYFGDGDFAAKAGKDGTLKKKLEGVQCNMSEDPSSNPTASRGDLNAPKGPGNQTGHTGKH